jgi:hypothetical protein
MVIGGTDGRGGISTTTARPCLERVEASHGELTLLSRWARSYGNGAGVPRDPRRCLDPLSLGALPDLDQSVACVVGIGRHPEVAPAHPT